MNTVYFLLTFDGTTPSRASHSFSFGDLCSNVTGSSLSSFYRLYRFNGPPYYIFLYLRLYSFVSTDRPQHKANSLVRNETVVLGRDATFYCRTEAFPVKIGYSWFKGDNQIYNSQDYAIDNFRNGESRLTVKQVKKSSAGRYSCYGRNDVGNGLKKSVFLTVHCELCVMLLYMACLAIFDVYFKLEVLQAYVSCLFIAILMLFYFCSAS